MGDLVFNVPKFIFSVLVHRFPLALATLTLLVWEVVGGTGDVANNICTYFPGWPGCGATVP